MGQPFVGEIRIFAGNFNPNGWMFCDGALLPISEYDTLFNLIGTTYGGDGQSTFGLPDLRGRVPIHMGTRSGTAYVLAESAGVESVTLTTQTMAGHTHVPVATNASQTVSPNGAIMAVATSSQAGVNIYGNGPPNVQLHPSSINNNGGSPLPHDNRQPLLGLNFIIALFGIFPSPT
jgi:microcystin-dependent protein